MPPPARLAVIVTCALLYACMCSPMLWHVQTANVPSAANFAIALGPATTDLLIQAVADQQKSAYKFSDAGKSRWCDVGVVQVQARITSAR